jgi:CrcB protein
MPEATRRRRELPVLVAIAAGGVLGALARYAIASGNETVFPWRTFAINVSGCLAIGVLLVVITEARSTHRLVRPFLGTGLLGGYTTFSTYAVETERLLSGHLLVAAAYLVGTALAALLAVQSGVVVTRRLMLPRREER